MRATLALQKQGRNLNQKHGETKYSKAANLAQEKQASPRAPGPGTAAPGQCGWGPAPVFFPLLLLSGFFDSTLAFFGFIVLFFHTALSCFGANSI